MNHTQSVKEDIPYLWSHQESFSANAEDLIKTLKNLDDQLAVFIHHGSIFFPRMHEFLTEHWQEQDVPAIQKTFQECAENVGSLHEIFNVIFSMSTDFPAIKPCLLASVTLVKNSRDALEKLHALIEQDSKPH